MFQVSIVNTYGEQGRAWLNRLPELVLKAALNFKLQDLKEVENLSCNYVLSGTQENHPIILKLGFDSQALNQESFALKCFADYGAAKILAEDEGMLLLERAFPSVSLKSYFPSKDSEAIKIACQVMKRLASAKMPQHHNLAHIHDWLAALDDDRGLPFDYLSKARKLRDQLLKTAESDILLHGDLHHDNILQNGDSWMVIDPKGVIGDPVYEVAAFICNPILDLAIQQNATQIIQNRITEFSGILGLSRTRIADWCFVKAVLSWVWALEDGSHADYWKQIAEIFM